MLEQSEESSFGIEDDVSSKESPQKEDILSICAARGIPIENLDPKFIPLLNQFVARKWIKKDDAIEKRIKAVYRQENREIPPRDVLFNLEALIGVRAYRAKQPEVLGEYSSLVMSFYEEHSLSQAKLNKERMSVVAKINLTQQELQIFFAAK